MWKVQLFNLNYDHREGEAVKAVIDGGWITMGEKTKEFENNFSNLLGGKVNCTAMSSCTATLHTALLTLDIQNGDEVIIPGLTFVADINVVLMARATPVLADCTDYENWNISAKSIERQITKKTKAVIIVHYGGYPCNMDEIVQLCKKNNIFLIEDVAHAPGAKYKGQACGTFGDVACFSFFTNKNLSTGEGGMFVTHSDLVDQKAKYIRSHGMDALSLDKYKGRTVSYDVLQPGLNYRMDEIHACLGLIQLEKLRHANEKRRELVERYIEQLNTFQGISIPFLNLSNIQPAYHIFPILLVEELNRKEVIEQLKLKGIQSSIHYPYFHEFTAFKNIGLNDAPIAEEIAKRELTLPLYPTMSFEQVDYVVKNLQEIIGGKP